MSQVELGQRLRVSALAAHSGEEERKKEETKKRIFLHLSSEKAKQGCVVTNMQKGKRKTKVINRAPKGGCG